MDKSRLLSTVDRFIEKATRVNKPLLALQKSDEFKSFTALMSDAILTQSKWTSENLPELFDKSGISNDLEPLTLDQEQRLKQQIAIDMPGVEKIVGIHKVFSYYKYVFEYSVKAQYRRFGYIVKAENVNFTLTNKNYIKALEDNANYLLNRSSIDDTTLEQLIDVIREGKMDGMTIQEVSKVIDYNFAEISETRADVIARTETAQAMGAGNYASMKENGVQNKRWVTAGSNPCEICQDNEAEGDIPLDADFPSGDSHEPAHPNDECYTEADEIDLDALDLWSGE